MFNDNLKMFMEKNDLTNTKLAKMLGVSEVAVSRWVSGQRNPRKVMIDRMCEIFNCTHNDLMQDHKDLDAYREVLKLLESLNTRGISEVINFIGNLDNQFMK